MKWVVGRETAGGWKKKEVNRKEKSRSLLW